MNIQTQSNSKNRVGGKNEINQFHMKLIEPIDAENQAKYIVLLSVSYPLTTKNIEKDKCFFYVDFQFGKFRQGDDSKQKIQSEDGTSFTDFNFDTGTLNFTSKKVVPDGVYDMDTLVRYMNNWLEEYNIIVENRKNGKISIHVTYGVEYWFRQTTTSQWKKRVTAHNSDPKYVDKYTKEPNKLVGGTVIVSVNSDALTYKDSSKAWNGGNTNVFQPGNATNPVVGGMKVSLVFSEKLKWMLGSFAKLENYYGNYMESTDNITKEAETITSTYMADSVDGINRLFIYCDEVEKSIVGDSKSSLLCTVPQKIEGQGSSQLETYFPPTIRRKLNKGIIHGFNVQVRDNKGEFVAFDSGSIAIECRVES